MQPLGWAILIAKQRRVSLHCKKEQAEVIEKQPITNFLNSL
jgi:hypothetical protein